MQQPRSALEYFKLAIAQERDLTERLKRQMVGPPVVERDCSHGIAKPSFLTRPSQPYVAHKTTGAFGHPIIGPNDHGIEVAAASDARGERQRKRSARSGTEMAERGGFEPPIGLHLCRIS